MIKGSIAKFLWFYIFTYNNKNSQYMNEMKESEKIENETEELSRESLAISVESSIRLPEASKYDGKLKFYAEECKRYSIEKVKIIQQCLKEIQSDCNLENFLIGSLQCQVMFEAFQIIPTSRLTVINLSKNFLEYFCCHSMASYIIVSDTLKELNLEGCQIGDKGVEILSPALATSISITNLNMSSNKISDDGGEVLVEFLRRNSTCEILKLSFNELSIKTARGLGSVLACNETLKELDLSHNSFYEQCAGVEIMKKISSNEALESLDLSWNGLNGEEFGKTLSKCVKKSSLKVLKLEHNRLSTFDFQKLYLGMKYSQVIQEVYVGWNFFVDGDDVTLVKAFGTDTPLQLLSFGDTFHLSHEAYGLYRDFQSVRPGIRVIYRGIYLPNPPHEVSILDICADRAKYLAMKPKKKRLKRDMRFFMLKLRSLESCFMVKDDFMKLLNAFNAKLDANLIEQYIEVCIASNEQLPIIDVHMMANHYLSRHKPVKAHN